MDYLKRSSVYRAASKRHPAFVAAATSAASPPPRTACSKMAGIVRQERVLLETPSTKLEAIVFTAPERTNGAAAVILHPYALLGAGG